MYIQSLKAAGLTEDEARVYEALLLRGPLKAGGLLSFVKPIKRPLLYKILERLKARGLVRDHAQDPGPTVFYPLSPDVLSSLINEQEELTKKHKQVLATALPELKAKYILTNERPVIRFFEGIDGLKRMYEETLRIKSKNHYFIRPLHASVYDMFGRWFTEYRKKLFACGVTTHGLTPDDPRANHDPEKDKSYRFERTWIRPHDYSAPVEISFHDNSVTLISYGEEIFGIAIESKPIAQAFHDLFQLAKRGADTITVDHDHESVKTPPTKEKKA